MHATKPRRAGRRSNVGRKAPPRHFRKRSDGEVDQLARSSSFSLLSQVVNAIAGSAFLAIVSRSLPQSQAGGLFEAIAIFSTGTWVATCGADIGLMRMMPFTREGGPGAVGRLLAVSTVPMAIVGLTMATVLYAYAPEIAHLMVTDPSLQAQATRQFRILTPLIPVAGLTTAVLAATRAWTVSPSIVVQYIALPLGRLLLIVPFLVLGLNLTSATISWSIPVLLAGLATCVAMWSVVCRDSWPARATRGPALWPLRQFWSFAGPRLLESALLAVLWGADVIIVGALTSPSDAAAYTVATRYVALATLALPAMLVAIPTRISDLMGRGRLGEAREIYRVATWWIMMVGLPCSAALAVYAPFLMSLFGGGYRVGDSTLVLLSTTVISNCVTGPAGTVILMSSNTSINLAITATAVVANVPLMFILVPGMGLLGAGVAGAVSMAILNGLGAVILWKKFRMSPLGRPFFYLMAATAVSFLIPAAAIRPIVGTNLVSFVLYCILAIPLYLLLMLRKRDELQLKSFMSMVRPGA